MKRFDDLSKWAITLDDESLSSKKTVGQWIRFIARLISYTVSEIIRDEVTEMAAALTYRTIFSLIPTIVLALIVFRAFGGFDQISTDVQERAFDYLGLSQLSIPERQSPDSSTITIETYDDHDIPLGPVSPVKPIAPLGPTIVITSTTTAPSSTQPTLSPAEIRAKRKALHSSIQVILAHLTNQVSTVSFAGIGGVGILFLVWGAMSLAVTIEQTFNRVYNTSVGRSWPYRIMMYWTIITLGPVLISVSLYLTSKVVLLVEDMGAVAFFMRTANWFGAMFASWLLLFVLYKRMPNTRVDTLPALIGSLIAALLFELGKSLFHFYLTTFVPFSKFYGTLALLPLFLLWLYTMWMIVLSGLEFSYTLQAMTSGDFKHQYLRRSQIVYQDPRILAVVLASIAREFGSGNVVTARFLHQKLGISTNDVSLALERLEEGLMIRKIPNPEHPNAFHYCLSRPADQIKLRDLYTIATPLSRSGQGLPVLMDPAYGWMQKVEISALGDTTLARIMNDPAIKPA